MEIKCAKDSVGQQLEDMKNLKFSKPYKFQKPDEDQYKFNVKLAETTDNKCYWEVVA